MAVGDRWRCPAIRWTLNLFFERLVLNLLLTPMSMLMDLK